MEFVVVVLIVLLAGTWLGIKTFRFIRAAIGPVRSGGPPCPNCPACTHDMVACNGQAGSSCAAFPEGDPFEVARETGARAK